MQKDEINIDDVIKDIISKHGKESIIRGKLFKKIDVDTVSTGSISLDIALGINGLPRGRIIEIFGQESSGKTTLALHIIAEAQKQKLLCAFVDAEQSLSLPYADKLGVDISKLLISSPNSGEEALDIVETLVKTKKVGVIVIDSVASLTPQAEIDADINSKHIGLQARLMSEGLRKITTIASRANTAIVFVNQTRAVIGQTWGPQTTTPGGVALKFYTTVRIEVKRAASLKDGDKFIGIRVKARVIKNKISAPFRTAEFDIIFGEGISRISELINIGLEHKIITKKGISLFFNKEKIGRSIQTAKEHLLAHSEIAEQIFKAIKIS